MHGGVAKLEDMRKSRLRYMMVQLALKRRIAAKIRNALVKSRLIARKKLTVAFARWRSYKELAILRSNLLGDATTAFQMPNLNRMMVKFYRQPLRYAFSRVRDGPRNLLERVGRKANEALNNQLRKANRCMLRSANNDNNKRNNMMWKWKVAQIAYSLGNQMAKQEEQHHGSQIICRVITQAKLRDQKIIIDKMKRSRGNIFINLWKVMERTADVSTRKAWTIWSNCLYKDQALDWEHHYMQSSALQPMFINFAKFHERQDFLAKCWAWGLWSSTPKKTLIKALNRVRTDIYANLRSTLLMWKMKCKLMENAKLARIMFLVADRLGDTSTFNKHYAFRLWAPVSMKSKIGETLKKLAIRTDSKLALAFFKWRENAEKVAHERTLQIVEANGNLQTMYVKYDKLNVKVFFDRWAAGNKKNRMRHIISKMMSNAENRQKDGFRQMKEAVQRQTIVVKTVSLCKMIVIKARDYEASLRDAFRLWKSLKGKRRRNLLWKYVNIFMNKCRIGYQPALWRWKCVIKKYDAQYIFPHHKIMMKHLYQVFGTAQDRLKQAAFLRCMVSHASPDIWASRQSIFQRESIFGVPPELSTSYGEHDSPELDATPRSDREHRMVILRESLLELTNIISKCYMKNVLSAFNLIQFYSDDLLSDSAIKDLREDNQALRFHNEALSDNLQRSTAEYDLMAQHLDGLRIQNLVRVLEVFFVRRDQDSFLRIQFSNNE